MLAALGSDDESTDKDSASDSENEKPIEKIAVPTRKEQKKGKDAKKDESLNQVAKETNATVKAKETGKGKAKKGKKVISLLNQPYSFSSSVYLRVHKLDCSIPDAFSSRYPKVKEGSDVWAFMIA
uniref:RRP15-like protein n=1 Tax=Ascaris lumbricoides TaxID=6252 RepID=A0A0M3HLI3_ASCLU